MKIGRPKPSKRFVFAALGIIMLGAGFCAFLYPAVSNYWIEQKAKNLILDYKKEAAETDAGKTDILFVQAKEYNQKLLNLSSAFVRAPFELTNYKDILNTGRSDLIGYIDIQKSGIQLPIRHGTEEQTLQTSAGHLEGSSFPTGDTNSHAVLVGHSGLPSAKLFTDIDKLEIDDVFSVTILNETFYYTVDRVSIVLPEDAEPELALVPHQDYVTLMTCTPYGVNTHRLLVRGTRFIPETDLKTFESVLPVLSDVSKIIIFATIVTLLILGGIFVIKHKRRS